MTVSVSDSNLTLNVVTVTSWFKTTRIPPSAKSYSRDVISNPPSASLCDAGTIATASANASTAAAIVIFIALLILYPHLFFLRSEGSKAGK